jgi:pSer/pThr/pTyr-binding forkhead associated (FHA) protein
MSAKVVLQVISGPIQGKRFEFDTHDTFLFGRSKECHARLPKDGYVSRHHFLLEVNPPEASIRDLGSLNGTHVNGVRYGGRKAYPASVDRNPAPGAQTVLKDQDVIMVGKTTISVHVAAESPDAAGLNVPTQTEVVGKKPDSVRSMRKQSPPTASPREGLHPGRAEVKVAAAAALDADEAGGLRALIRQAARDVQSPQKIEVEGYEIGELLGKGSMGVVYKAIRTLDQLPVAIKVMLAKVAVHEAVRQRFLREIEIIRRLGHANIVALIASGSVRSAFYFVGEFCSGGSLADLAVRQGGRVPLPVLAPIILQSLNGLAHAHKLGFVHRDIKPANILLHQQQHRWAAKMGDFGLAKQFERSGLSGMTLTGAVGGTYDYMPREQLTDFKNSLPVSDVWSMGATFYRALTGLPPRPCPIGRDPMEVVLRKEHVPIRQRDSGLPPALARVIDTSLAIETADRYQDAGKMHQALKQVLSQSSR